jgi:hypothetical protein
MKILSAVAMLPSLPGHWRCHSWLLPVCCPLSLWGKARPRRDVPDGTGDQDFCGGGGEGI